MTLDHRLLHRAAAARSPVPPSRAQAVRPHALHPALALQAQAGNRAVTSVVGTRRVPRRQIARVMAIDAFRKQAAAIDRTALDDASALAPLLAAMDRYRLAPRRAGFDDILAARREISDAEQSKFGTVLASFDARLINPWRETFWAVADVSPLLARIAAMPAEERRALLADDEVLAWVRGRTADGYPPAEATAIMATLLVGSIRYALEPGSRSIRDLLELPALAAQPPDLLAANCFEYPMYAAYLAENLSGQQLIEFMSLQGWGGPTSYRRLGWRDELPEIGQGGGPAVGDLVFITDLDDIAKIAGRPAKKAQFSYPGETPKHVVLSVGNGMCLSHDSGGPPQLAHLGSLEAQYPTHRFRLQYAAPPW